MEHKGNKPTEEPHDADEAPGGAAQFDPGQQSHRQDMEDAENEGEGRPTRGNLPPGAPSDRAKTHKPALPGSPVDRGEKPTRGGQRGAWPREDAASE